MRSANFLKFIAVFLNIILLLISFLTLFLSSAGAGLLLGSGSLLNLIIPFTAQIRRSRFLAGLAMLCNLLFLVAAHKLIFLSPEGPTKLWCLIGLWLILAALIGFYFSIQQWKQKQKPITTKKIHVYEKIITQALAFLIIVAAAYYLFSTAQITKTFLKIKNSKSHQELQVALDKQFPFGTPVASIDAVLVNKWGAYRSDNLIELYGRGNYRKGTSSADNFIFYYRPVSPAGKNGWEDASSGWVIEVIHGDIHDAAGKRGKGLKQVIVLTTPDEQKEGKPDEHIALAKDLLQYKIDLIPVDTFDEKEWSALVESHKNSPCKKELTSGCLMQQALQLLNIETDSAKISYPKFLADIAIENGDTKTAEILVKAWPTADEIRAHEESIPRPRKRSPSEIENIILGFHIDYIQLLFLTGNYEEAEKLLVALHKQLKNGSDYGALNALVKRGDLEQAQKIARLTLEWKREVPDPKENSSAHMHCDTYRDPKTLPAAMGDLAQAYIEKGNLDQAYKIAKLVHHYWENKAFGQSSYCYTDFAKGSYFHAMKALVEAYTAQNNKEKARAIFKELNSVFQGHTELFTRYGLWPFEQLASTAAKNGITDSLEDMAAFVQTHNQMDYSESHRQSRIDPVPMIYALAGNYQKATDYFENSNPTRNKLPPSEVDKLFNRQETPAEEIELTTYLKIARTLANMGDKKGALLFLEKASPDLGIRKRLRISDPEKDFLILNMNDYINQANIFLDLNEKEKSQDIFENLLSRFNEIPKKDFREGYIFTDFYGALAYLYAHHDNIEKVQSWADKLPSYYQDADYSRIAELLIKEKRWNELDTYFYEMSDVFSTDSGPLVNWDHFVDALIEAGEFDRYLRFIDMLNEGTEKAKKRRVNFRSMVREDRPKTPDTDQQIWLMSQLLVSKLARNNVPDDVIESIWPRYITNCRSKDYILPRYENGLDKKFDAKEIMASCYVVLIQGIEFDKEFKERAKRWAENY